jgi:hypothetical protein
VFADDVTLSLHGDELLVQGLDPSEAYELSAVNLLGQRQWLQVGVGSGFGESRITLPRDGQVVIVTLWTETGSRLSQTIYR